MNFGNENTSRPERQRVRRACLTTLCESTCDVHRAVRRGTMTLSDRPAVSTPASSDRFR